MNFVISQSRPPRQVKPGIPERHARVAKAIIEAGYTLESVAAVAGYNRSALDNIVAGKIVRDCTLCDFEDALGLGRGGYELTPRQRTALLRLLELHETYTSNKTHGFSAQSVRELNASACRYCLEALGLVRIQRSNGLSRGFRYMLTDAGFTEARKLKERRP